MEAHQPSSEKAGEAARCPTDLFCWTKIGMGAGESLKMILRRKEWERQLGDGRFLWGVGSLPGSGTQQHIRGHETIPVRFSKIKANPRLVDRAPPAIWLWRTYVDIDGHKHPLPTHVLVTSREKNKAVHGALFCHSALTLENDGTRHNDDVDPAELVNASSGRPFGSSQVTAFVRRTHRLGGAQQRRPHAVLINADLVGPKWVRLADPLPLSKSARHEMEDIVSNGSLDAWQTFVDRVRA